MESPARLPWTPLGSAGCWTATLSGSPLFRPYQTPLPLGEGGRRPGEGPQKPCRSHSLPVDTGLLAAGTLTPTLSQRERGQFDTACTSGWRVQPASHGPHLDPPAAGQLRCQDPRCSGRIKPLSLWERVAEGRVRVPKNPAAPIHCRRHRPACSGHPHPNPLPEGEGAVLTRPVQRDGESSPPPMDPTWIRRLLDSYAVRIPAVQAVSNPSPSGRGWPKAG